MHVIFSFEAAMIDSTQQFQSSDSWTMGSGAKAIIRPIDGNDEMMMARFHRTLSPDSVYARYFNTAKLSERIAHARLDRICHPDSSGETVLVVETPTMDGDGRQIVAVGRLSILPAINVGELAIIVSDLYQHQGIGSELLRRLVEAARERKLHQVRAYILSRNIVMQRLCATAGMRVTDGLNADEVTAVMDL